MAERRGTPAPDDVLSEWLAAYGDLINRTCCLLLNDRTLAEDAAQEAFLRAWRSMAQYRGDPPEQQLLLFRMWDESLYLKLPITLK